MVKIYPMDANYEEYLVDESRFSGTAESISFPENETEVRQVIQIMKEQGVSITIQGGKTGIAGGAVPLCGHIMNLSRMNHFLGFEKRADGAMIATAEAGITLLELRKEISRIKERPSLFWPVDPTETSASLGGIAAVHAQGPGQRLYGVTRNYLHAIKMLTGTGEVITLSQETMDLDHAVGREGTTGVILELSVILKPKPKKMWAIGFMFEEEEAAAAFAHCLSAAKESELANLAAAEFLDREVIQMIEKRKPYMTKVKELPEVGDACQAMIMTELHGSEDEIENTAEWLMEQVIECGGDPDQAWAVSDEAEVEKLRAFRHAAAEAVNLYIEERSRIEKGITKLGTDMSIRGIAFPQVLARLRTDLAEEGLKAVIFGHIFDNHLHVNILPEDLADYQRGMKLIEVWMSRVRKEKGAVTTEHGIGKLKQKLYRLYGDEAFIKQCQALKEKYDPLLLFNQGNIL